MVILLVTYTIAKGTREEFVSELKKSSFVDTTRNEDGNISYEYFFPESGPENVLYLVEKWESREKLDMHMNAPNMKIATGLKEMFNAETKVEIYEVQ